MDKITKEEYLKLLEDLGEELPSSKIIRDFINSYEGPESPELHNLLITTIDLCIDHAYLKTKADFYDELEEIRENTENEYNKITEEADEEELILEDIIAPVTSSNTKEENDETK